MRRRLFFAVLAAAILAAGCVLFWPSDGTVPSYRADLRPGAPPRFLLFGDTREVLSTEFWRSEDETRRLLVMQALAGEDPAFIVNTGDLVGYGAKAESWRKFHERHQPIFSKGIPYFPVLGNHEYYGGNREALGNYFASFPGLGSRKWYEIRFPPALIVVLDSNFSDLEPGEIEEQDQWLTGILDAAEKDTSLRHVIVCCHHPPYTNSRQHGDSKGVQEHFVARKTPKVRAFFTGHVHSYERFVRDGVQYVVSGGGGAPPYNVEAGKRRHKDEYSGPRSCNYGRFTFAGDRLVCEILMLQDDGTWKRVDGFECP